MPTVFPTKDSRLETQRSISAFVKEQTLLLKMERAAEVAEVAGLISGDVPFWKLEQKGVVLLYLKKSAVKPGLHGRSVLHLKPKNASGFPRHKLTAGKAAN
jgi:hypothetical protein